MSSNKSNKLEEILKEINQKKVQLNKDAKTRNYQTLEEVLDAVEDEFKKDTLFKALFTQRRRAGSYFEGLKVSAPVEYDINIVLKVPKLATYVITTLELGHVKIRIKMDEIYKHDYLAKYRGLTKLLDDDGFLSVKKTNAWFQGLLDKALWNLKDQFAFTFSIRPSSSGPARTIIVNDSFAIDLVPAFWMLKVYWPDNYKESELDKEFLVVPKPIENEPLLWRCSFYEHEKELLHGFERVKGVIRLLKVLRDEQNHLYALKSYFIKTVFLLEVWKDVRFKRMSLSAIFMEMLEKLETYVRERNIPFYWHKDLNLLKPNPYLWTDIANSLNSIRSNIIRDPRKAYVYFNVDEADRLSDELAVATISDDDLRSDMKQKNGLTGEQKMLIGGSIAVGALALCGMIAGAFAHNANRRNHS